MKTYKDVTKESMQVYIANYKEYIEVCDTLKRLQERNKKEDAYLIQQKKKRKLELFEWIENFIVNVINKDKEYYSKLTEYHFSNEDLAFCMGSGY